MTPIPTAAPPRSGPFRPDTVLVGPRPGPDELVDALGGIVSDRRALRAWLTARAAPRAATEIAAVSYWHHNGFAKLVLHVGDGFRIRLHVWPSGPDRRGETNPHGHRWDFASTVLCGAGLASTEYRESPTGMAYVRHAYTGGPEVGKLLPTGNAHLVEDDKRVVRKHDRYAVTTDVVHTIDPLGTDLVATLVVQGPPRLVSTVVFCAPGLPADQPGERITAAEVSGLLHEVADELDR